MASGMVLTQRRAGLECEQGEVQEVQDKESGLQRNPLARQAGEAARGSAQTRLPRWRSSCWLGLETTPACWPGAAPSPSSPARPDLEIWTLASSTLGERQAAS